MIDVPQANGDQLVAPPFWTGIVIDSRPAALFVCPNAHTILLSYDYDVDRLGYVQPQVSCKVLHCGFQKHVRLLGWRPWLEATTK